MDFYQVRQEVVEELIIVANHIKNAGDTEQKAPVSPAFSIFTYSKSAIYYRCFTKNKVQGKFRFYAALRPYNDDANRGLFLIHFVDKVFIVLRDGGTAQL